MTSSRPVSRQDYVTLAEFRHALRVFQRFSEDAARSAGVTPAQHQLVLAIKGWPRPNRPSVSDIAERAGMTPGHVTYYFPATRERAWRIMSS